MFLFLKSQHGNKQATTYHIGTEWWRNAFGKQILPDNGLEKVMVHYFIKSSVAWPQSFMTVLLKQLKQHTSTLCSRLTG